MTFIQCPRCGTKNSAFNPTCIECFAPNGVALPASFVPSETRPSAPTNSEWCGRKVGSYLVEECLAKGSTGDVLRAKDPRGNIVAIKVILPHLADDIDVVRRFAREVRALEAIQSPYVARLVEALSSPMALVLEYLPGESLERRLGRGPVGLDEALGLFEAVATGLSALHDGGIVHRDLKPANIILGDGPSDPSSARIVDLGLVRFLESNPLSMRTANNVLLGTLAYSPPESLLGEAPSPAGDLWSLGVIVYQTISGKMPFTGASRRALFSSVLSHSAPDLPAPEEVQTLVASLLEKDPSKRPASAAAVLSVLASAREHLELDH